MRTKGLSKKIRASLVAVIASLSSVATSYIETGAPSDVALGALAAAVFSAIGAYVAGPDETEPVRADGVTALRELMGPSISPDTGRVVEAPDGLRAGEYTAEYTGPMTYEELRAAYQKDRDAGNV